MTFNFELCLNEYKCMFYHLLDGCIYQKGGGYDNNLVNMFIQKII